jgi:hypothetical protein
MKAMAQGDGFRKLAIQLPPEALKKDLAAFYTFHNG